MVATLLLPMALSAQTQTENHIVNKVYKKATTTAVTTQDRDSVTTSITYFDGLGRPIQSVAVQAGGSLMHRNGLLYDWSLGNTGSTPFYTQEGTNDENSIVNGTTPFGHTDLLWECKGIQDNGGSQGDGGWITDPIAIDKTKPYRYTVWIKRNHATDGTTLFGTTDVQNLDGTANGNPYFWSGDLPQADTWYLLVGYIHPSDYTGSDIGISGVYDTGGTKVLDGTEFKWSSTTTTARFRNYLFYATGNPSVRQYFWSPLVQKMDGSELSISEVLGTLSVIPNEETIVDIVTHMEYDNYGRQVKEYLPFANYSSDGAYRTGDIALVTQNYYKQKHANDFANSLVSEVNAYSEKTLESSPLGRIFEQTAPGEAWKKGTNTITGKGYSDGHSIRFEYDTNSASEVRLYEVSLSFANHTYTPTLTGGSSYYPAGELMKNITKDENWTVADGLKHTTEEFKDKNGQVVLKRTYAEVGSPSVVEGHDTYYIYDDYGNLTYVLPPKIDTSDGVSASELDELGYQYKYDHRNRLVEKKIPGKGWEYIVYNRLDQPVLTQDAVQRANNSWTFTKYDKLGRVILTGRKSSSLSRTAYQDLASAPNSYTQYEDPVTTANTYGGSQVYYTSNAIPASSMQEIYTINYYDAYKDLPSGFTVPTSVYGQSVTTNTKGLATVSKVRVLGVSPEQWITTITYYDEKARPVYVYSENAYLGTTDIVESKLDNFTGKLLETKTTHKKTGNTDIVTIDSFTYDHMDRLFSQTQKVNNQTSERLVQNHYDELGQLESKLVGSGTHKGYANVSAEINIANDMSSKTGSSYSWDAGLTTLGSFSGDGYVEFEVPQTNKNIMVGLAAENTDPSYTSIDYAIYMTASGGLIIYESGTHKGTFGSYSANDVFSVERMGDKVYYKKNNETFYVSQTLSSGSLLGDISLYTPGATVKNLHLVDNSKGLQKVDYAYNVRGWLKNINNDADNDNDLFNFSLQYNDPTSGTALYNGNISQTSWNTLNTDSSTRTYTYSYDALNRITSGIDNTGNYNLTSVSYDKNGNILNLQRQGHTNAGATTFGVMDNLGYTYDTDSNQLLAVSDSSGVKEGFDDKNATGNDYTYDVNGNMITDKNKNITSIAYNHLNLPTKVVFNNNDPLFSQNPEAIEYVYDAVGMKLKKTVKNGSVTTNTDYTGNYIYENGTLQFFNHAEGYTKYDGGTMTTLIDDTFDSGTDTWQASGVSTVVQQDNGRLKVTLSGQNEGAKRTTSVSVGDRIEYNITLDKGTTDKLTFIIMEHDINNNVLKLTVPTHEEDGYYRGTYVVSNSNTTKLRIKIEKSPGADNGTSTEFFIDNVNMAKVSHTGDLHANVYQYKDHLGNVRLSYADTNNDGTIDASIEIIEESNYYPFGLKHKGYNYVISSNGNSIAQKFKYNGMELENALGIDWYEMDMRQYDPAIARWTAIDPVTHHSMSTYTAFDNNPIFWADPSGADANLGPMYAAFMQEEGSDPPGWLKAINNFIQKVFVKAPTKFGKTVAENTEIKVSSGAVVGVNVGKYGVEANFGSTEIGTLSTEGWTEGNPNKESSGFNISYGAGEVGVKKTTTTTTVEDKMEIGSEGNKYEVPVQRETTVTTNEGSATIFGFGVESKKTTYSTKIYNGPLVYQLPEYTERNNSPSASQTVGGIKKKAVKKLTNSARVSIAFGVKIEIGLKN